MLNEKSVADIEGPWNSPTEETTGLIERCKLHWSVPAHKLPDVMVATYLNQRIAVMLMIDEARRRIASEVGDDSELYDGQFAEALRGAEANSI